VVLLLLLLLLLVAGACSVLLLVLVRLRRTPLRRIGAATPHISTGIAAAAAAAKRSVLLTRRQRGGVLLLQALLPLEDHWWLSRLRGETHVSRLTRRARSARLRDQLVFKRTIRSSTDWSIA